MEAMEQPPASVPPGMSTMMGVDCNGGPLYLGGGTWIGHMIPGTFFLLWGLHWGLAAYRRYIRSQRTGTVYSSKAWYPVGRWRYVHYIEPICKCIAGPIGMSIELYFDDPDGFRPLFCKNSGQFAMKYAHNYQHASMYPAFVISGLVDFIGTRFPLPPGTEQAFTAFSFAIEGLLMLVHKKHYPLDGVLHNTLSLVMIATAIATLLELKSPHNFLLSCARSMTLTMHGMWMMVMGQMLFTGSKSWTDDYTGPAMLAPPFFAQVFSALAFSYVLVYVVMAWWDQRTQPYHALPLMTKTEAGSKALSEEGFEGEDSAHEISDDGLESGDSSVAKDGQSRQQLVAALSKFKIGHTRGKSDHIV